MKRLALILAFVLLLAACAELPPPAETAPPQTASPVETALPSETTSPALSDSFDEWYALLEYPDEGFNWLRSAMGCVFEKTSDIDLEYLFYGGFREGSWDMLSPESENALLEQGFRCEMDLQPMPTARIEEILSSTLGVSLSDCTIPNGWLYAEAEDFYCSNHNDAYFPSPFTITAVEDDGRTIHIHYHVDDCFYNTATGGFLENTDMIYCLERREDGSYRAVFNVPAS